MVDMEQLKDKSRGELLAEAAELLSRMTDEQFSEFIASWVERIRGRNNESKD